MAPTKETDKAPVTNPKEMETDVLPKKESKMISFKNLNKMKGKTDWQLNDTRKTMQGQKKFNFKKNKKT